jgi:hypothetical protein
VFVSHSSRDTWVAEQLAKHIQRTGATPFLDAASIETGADFEDEILAFLNRAHELVVLVTPWALDRPYIWAELGAAWSRRIPIILLLHGLTASELQSRPGAPVFLKAKNCRDLNEAGRYLKELKGRASATPRVTS